ncbi:MAG TPA: hypothetical protein PKA62_09895 [Thermoanaerobaculia bacterium]|nr:hypothetical protein [Thermoanaerobaculia bacterium]
MRRLFPALAFLLLLCVASRAALAAGGAAGASAPSPPARSSVEKTAEGQVTELAAGSHVTLRTDDGATLTFRLDEPGLDSKVAPGVAVGSRVRVVESRLPDGKRSVSVTVVPAPDAPS